MLTSVKEFKLSTLDTAYSWCQPPRSTPLPLPKGNEAWMLRARKGEESAVHVTLVTLDT